MLIEDVKLFKLSRSVMKLEKVVAFTASPPNEAKTNSLGFWLRKDAMSDSISEIKGRRKLEPLFYYS